MTTEDIKIKQKTLCFHCGNECSGNSLIFDDKNFCCTGCRTVYSLLKENDLCYYYDLEKNPGNSLSEKPASHFDFLELEEFKKDLITYSDDNISRLEFYVPGMHCLSCIWLLEHLHKIKPGIMASRADFHKKKVYVDILPQKITISETAQLLSSLGYEPYFNKQNQNKISLAEKIPIRIRKIAVAGFAFGNIMLLSFPEYLGLTNFDKNDKFFHQLFSWLNIGLSIPVLFYSASEFFVNSIQSFKNKYLNIDAPVALALLITFFRSLYEIFYLDEHGYFDSLSGIVFFMLIARYVQEKSSWWAGPGKELKNFLPMAVWVLDDKGNEQLKPVDEIQEGSVIRVLHGEVVPADSVLLSDEAHFNLAMLNGESNSVKKIKFQNVYAGSKNEGKSIYLKVTKPMKESYFTRLWNNMQMAHKEDVELDKKFYVTQISKYFTYVVFALSFLGFSYHYFFTDTEKAFKVLTTVLIIACPCALLLASGFTSGMGLHELRKLGIYFRNEKIPDEFSRCKTWVLDKTGTLSYRDKSEIVYHGRALTEDELSMTAELTSHSKHPLSRKIYESLRGFKCQRTLTNYEEFPGKGLRGGFDGNTEIKIGSMEFTGTNINITQKGTHVFVSINGDPKGYFLIKNKWRKNIDKLFEHLNRLGIKTIVATGDHPDAIGEEEKSWKTNIFAGLKPDQKVAIIKKEQNKGLKVCMIGDGMNDVPALSASDISITVNEGGNQFLPESDMILDARFVPFLDKIRQFAMRMRTVIIICFVFSLIYNFIGLYYALSASLKPVIAAILMPASTTAILLTGYIGIQVIATKLKNDLDHDSN
ncbi:MAG: heavy metal translocating P-type ATPase [Bacteroidia bacterium]|nr:heavy metal translocating P-type ATPase [Bacteroidia bacterium]